MSWWTWLFHVPVVILGYYFIISFVLATVVAYFHYEVHGKKRPRRESACNYRNSSGNGNESLQGTMNHTAGDNRGQQPLHDGDQIKMDLTLEISSAAARFLDHHPTARDGGKVPSADTRTDAAGTLPQGANWAPSPVEAKIPAGGILCQSQPEANARRSSSITSLSQGRPGPSSLSATTLLTR